ncbi:MAG: hypothetical protein Q9220_003951 [cf. Caloplaca sp. 1 TL-2023]
MTGIFDGSSSPGMDLYVALAPLGRLKPLCARNPNVCPQFVPGMSSLAEKLRHRKSTQNVRRSAAPSVSAHEKGRREYLSKVRQNGNDRKWSVRGEQVLRQDFLSSERSWLESLNRSAPALPTSAEDEDVNISGTNEEQQPEYMIDRILSEEQEDVTALISTFEEDPPLTSQESNGLLGYGSDGESYDSIFTEMSMKNNTNSIAEQNPPEDSTELRTKSDYDQNMDTAGG